MEAEAGVGLERAEHLAPAPVDQREPGAALGLPAVVLDVGTAGERQRQRVDDERELGEHDPALGEPERVHVGGLAGRQRSPRTSGLAPARGAEPEEAVVVAGPELGRVVEHPAARAIEVRVRRRQRPRHLPGDARRGERLGVELDRDRRLGHRDETLAELDEVDVAVVGERRPEQRHRPLEQRAARIGGELRVADLARSRPRPGRPCSRGTGSHRRPRRRRTRSGGASRARRTSGSSARSPTSNFAGPVRSSEPPSQAGISPSTGRASIRVSSLERLEPECGTSHVRLLDRRAGGERQL